MVSWTNKVVMKVVGNVKLCYRLKVSPTGFSVKLNEEYERKESYGQFQDLWPDHGMNMGSI